MRILKPGEKAPASGEYEIVGPRGGHTGEERTVPKGRPLPPRRIPARAIASRDVLTIALATGSNDWVSARASKRDEDENSRNTRESARKKPL